MRGAGLPPFRFSWRKLWAFTGPAWLMTLAYLDPGNLESDLQMGAYTSVKLTWVLFWATVMGLILQEMAARLALVTGKDLAMTVRDQYPRWLNYTIYVMMEIAVIGSDIQEVVGSAISINLLSNGAVAVWVGCIITGLDTFTFLAVHYLGTRYLEALIFMLISAMAVCFFVNWAMSPPIGAELPRGWIIPSIQSWAVTQTVGAVGAVIMPHNLYLHSGLMLSREVNRKSQTELRDAIWYSRIESTVALSLSFMINLAVVAANAANFYSENCAEIAEGPFACLPDQAFNLSGDAGHQGQGGACHMPSGEVGKCGALGLKAEGFALAGTLGDKAKYVWALGLLAAGQASTMTCTYAGQMIMGGCVHLEMKAWKRVAVTRLFALAPALIVATATVSDQTLFININEYLNVLQSVQLPFAMLPVLYFIQSSALLGNWRSKGLPLILGTGLALLVMGVNVYLVFTFLAAEDVSSTAIVFVCLYGIFYFFVCLAMVRIDPVTVLYSVRDAWKFRQLRRDAEGSLRLHNKVQEAQVTNSATHQASAIVSPPVSP